MTVLWLAWKDFTHPGYGGAEIVMRELMKRQLEDGHRVTLLTSRHKGSKERENLEGIDIIRIGGNRYLHSAQALAYYLRKLHGKFDMLIETVNTAPYFSLLFRGQTKGFAFYHQLSREIWHFETSKPLNYMGYYFMEPLATWLLGKSGTPLITVSDSTKRDLARYGWQPHRSHLISEGIEIEPVDSLDGIKKFRLPTILSLGAMRSMKRTLHQVKAFELAKKQIPNLQMKIAGDSSGEYGAEVLKYIQNSPYHNSIEYLGRVSIPEKIELMQKSHLITVTSVKEGWGLIVTEAASQGTPAIVYDVDGLRDSVKNEVTGLITVQTPRALGEGIVLGLQDKTLYKRLRQNAWEWSKEINFDNSYQDFKEIVEAYA